MEITPEFWVVPSWHEPPAQARHVIRLDPGLAFGTGTHPTTRMCLRWLARRPSGALPQRVLDYGCGSGILAIGAALLGAGAVDAVDIDPAAVQATRDNAARNGVPGTVLAPGLPDAARGAYDLVLAGILERQADELTLAYAPWLALAVSDREDGWILMTAQRPAPATAAPAGPA